MTVNGNSAVSLASGNNANAVFGATPIITGKVEAVLTLSSGTGGFAQVGLGSSIGFGAGLFLATAGNSWFNVNNVPGIASMAITPVAGQYHLTYETRGGNVFANLAGPSGAFAGSASGVVASLGGTGTPTGPPFITLGAVVNPGGGVGLTFESFRARSFASIGYQARDIIHLNDVARTNTRQNPSGVEKIDLAGGAKGRIPQLPVVPTAGGVVALSMPFDQGPANDVVSVDIRVRERFIFSA